MNHPIWDLPASGLLIAFVAIVHVFVSHFAVGGGGSDSSRRPRSTMRAP